MRAAGIEDITAQPGTSCQIEFQLIQMFAAMRRALADLLSGLIAAKQVLQFVGTFNRRV